MALNRVSLYNNFLVRHLMICPRRLSSVTSQTSSKNEVRTRVEIPTRIERGPTDILESLASTLERDFTAAHYKFHDDPFLTPMSNLTKRTYALSKESGRKAARYFLDKYPHLFYRDDAEPKIPRFSYSDTFTDETTVDESDLINCIQCRQVENAVQVYKNCKKANINLSQESLQSLLELLCFFNSKESPDDEFLEASWYKQREERSDKKKTWKDASIAEEVFESLPEKTPEAVNAFICGLGRFNAADKAYKTFEEARGQNMLLDTDTYNYIIKTIPFLRGSGDSRWELILDILRDMSITNTKPNLGTLNEILEILSRLGTWKHAKTMALKIISEMKATGVEPSLGSFSLLLTVFVNDRTGGASPQVLYDIMDQLDNTVFNIRHPKDVTFFVTAMSVANDPLADLDLAFRIHQLLLLGDNYKLIGDALKESVYYQNLMKLLCTSETMDGLRDFYLKYVPSVYTPEPGVMAEIIQAVDFHEGYDFLPFLWTDIVAFEYVTRDQVYKPFLRAISSPRIKDKELLDKLVKVTDDFMQKIDIAVSQEKYGSAQTVWSGDQLSACMKIYLNASNIEKATEILKKLSEKQNEIAGFADTEVLQEYCQKVIETKETDYLVLCCKYANDVGNDFVMKYVAESMDKIPQDDPNRKKLTQLIQNVS